MYITDFPLKCCEIANLRENLPPMADMRAPIESWIGIEEQPHTMGYDFQEINTDDFIALCREVGAEPFITINPLWSTAEENAAWVEYCNGEIEFTLCYTLINLKCDIYDQIQR